MRTGFAVISLLAAGALGGACSAEAPGLYEPVSSVEQGVRCGANGAGDTCHSICPCVSGFGDCDFDAECQAGLVCGTDNGAKFQMNPSFDICVPALCINGVQDAGNGETGIDCGGPCGECAGGPSCPPNGQADSCSLQCPCASGWGLCDSTAECQAGLQCAPDLGARFGMNALFDVCIAPHCTNGVQDAPEGETGIDVGGPCGGCPANNLGNTCSVSCRCTNGWGDCDATTECQAGLVCPVIANGKKFGLKAAFQACVPAHCQNGSLDAAQGEVKPDCGGPCGTCETSCTNGVDDDGDGFADCDDVECTGGCGGTDATLVSVHTSGAQGNGVSTLSGLSSDGAIVVFDSLATNLVASDTNARDDVFVRAASTTTVVSVDGTGAVGNHQSNVPVVSGDGNLVAFQSLSRTLVTGDVNNQQDIFVRNRTAATTVRVSVDSAGVESNGHSSRPSISSNGAFVAFQSGATNLVAGDGNAVFDVFIHQIAGGATTRVSLTSGGAEANSDSLLPSLSSDGNLVAFRSQASNLVGGDTNGFFDIFVRDRSGATTTRVSVSSGAAQSNGGSDHPQISGNGRYVVFTSSGTNLVSGDSNGVADIFRHDRNTGVTERVSVDTAEAQGNGASAEPAISADGRYVVFESLSTNLVSGDSNGVSDVFVRDMTSGTTRRVSATAAGVQGNGGSFFAEISGDGAQVAFASAATNLAAGDANGFQDVFVKPRP